MARGNGPAVSTWKHVALPGGTESDDGRAATVGEPCDPTSFLIALVAAILGAGAASRSAA